MTTSGSVSVIQVGEFERLLSAPWCDARAGEPSGIALVDLEPDLDVDAVVGSDKCDEMWILTNDGTGTMSLAHTPIESSGKQAYVEGVVKLATLSEKEARHYAEESKSGNANAIRGPQRELGFTASGVRLVRD